MAGNFGCTKCLVCARESYVPLTKHQQAGDKDEDASDRVLCPHMLAQVWMKSDAASHKVLPR